MAARTKKAPPAAADTAVFAAAAAAAVAREEGAERLEERRYLASVRVVNFQNHEDTTVEFDPGMNLIVGSSNEGKSALLRAINWALYNVPRRPTLRVDGAPSFIRIGSPEARVILTFSDGTTVERIRSARAGGVNSVRVRRLDGADLMFDKIGAGEYPQQVKEALGNPPEDELFGPLAWANQIAPPFLVSLSPTELPRCLSRLLGLADLESAQQELGRQANQSGRAAREASDRVAEFDQKLTAFEGLDEEVERFAIWEAQMAEVTTEYAAVGQMRRLFERYQDVVVTGKAASRAIKAAEEIAALDVETPLDFAAEVGAMVALAQEYAQCEAEESRLTRKHAHLDLTETSLSDGIQAAEALFAEVAAMKELHAEFIEVMAQGKAAAGRVKAAEEALAELVAEEQELLSRLRGSGLWCDRCQRPVPMGHDAGHVGHAGHAETEEGG